MRDKLLECLIRDESKVTIATGNSYVRAYPEFLRYFRDLPVITAHHVVIGASFTYSWMPTILKLRMEENQELDLIAGILNSARKLTIDNSDLQKIAKLVNNSLVGASKLLHFVNPQLYAIWDSSVCRYVFGSAWNYQVQDPALYQEYQDACQAVVKQPAFKPLHDSIN